MRHFSSAAKAEVKGLEEDLAKTLVGPTLDERLKGFFGRFKRNLASARELSEGGAPPDRAPFIPGIGSLAGAAGAVGAGSQSNAALGRGSAAAFSAIAQVGQRNMLEELKLLATQGRDQVRELREINTNTRAGGGGLAVAQL